jgi:soluble lytic murein transglycosylase-like protein
LERILLIIRQDNIFNPISHKMIFNNLDSITYYPGAKIGRGLNAIQKVRSNLMPSATGADFKDLLAAFQTQPAKNKFKIRGLTIVDYRARPVISKSRFRPRLESAATQLKNATTSQFAEPQTRPTIQKDILKSRLPCAQKIKAADSTEESEIRIDSQAADLTEQQIIEKKVLKAAEKYNLPPELIKAVIRAESNFEVQAVSSAGAQGLMQLMPTTAKELGVNNPFDIEQNIDGGAKYLRMMLDRFGGSLRKALAAYNAGPGTVSKYAGQVPYPETRQYVQRVLRFSRQMV